MELFHVLNRGVEGRDLFLDSGDHVRFIHNLFQFNDRTAAPQANRRNDVGFTKPNIERERLVDIHGWTLMKNHYHLLISEHNEGDLSLFLRKINIGYANYFNERYKRSGTLFQGRTKKILIDNDAHFLYILHYLHLNPLDYLKGSENWRVRDGMRAVNLNEAISHLEEYRWSSYLDYSGKKNFPSILTTKLFSEALGDIELATKNYLSESVVETDASFKKLTLE
jgi:putative transposase